jgi:hypothetical protein
MKKGLLTIGLIAGLAGLASVEARAADSYADYPPELELSLSVSNLDYRKGSFNQMLERYRDIPENGELKWLHYRSTDLPDYDLEVWVKNAGRDHGWAAATLAVANSLFIFVEGAGIPYNVDSESGFKRFKSTGRVEWLPTGWLTVYGGLSEEDKTGRRSETQAVGQKAETMTWGAAADWKPVYVLVNGVSEDLSETEFGNSMSLVEYAGQLQPSDRLLLSLGGSVAGLDSRRTAGPTPTEANLNTVSAGASYELARDWTADISYDGVDYGDDNEGGLDMRSTRVSGAVSFYFPDGMVQVHGASEDRDYVGADITGQEIRTTGIRARYRYRGYQLNAYHDAENRDTSGIGNIHLTNTEDLPLQSRVSGASISGMPVLNLFVQYNLRFVENNYNRVDVVGVYLHKYRHQSFTASYPLTERVSVAYTFSDNEFLSRGSRYFLTGDTEILATQLVENTEYHRVYLDVGMGKRWSGALGYGVSKADGAEEFAGNMVKAYDYETTFKYRASDTATLTLRWVYDSYQDRLALSPNANANWIELWATLKI